MSPSPQCQTFAPLLRLGRSDTRDHGPQQEEPGPGGRRRLHHYVLGNNLAANMGSRPHAKQLWTGRLGNDGDTVRFHDIPGVPIWGSRLWHWSTSQ